MLDKAQVYPDKPLQVTATVAMLTWFPGTWPGNQVGCLVQLQGGGVTVVMLTWSPGRWLRLTKLITCTTRHFELSAADLYNI